MLGWGWALLWTRIADERVDSEGVGVSTAEDFRRLGRRGGGCLLQGNWAGRGGRFGCRCGGEVLCGRKCGGCGRGVERLIGLIFQYRKSIGILMGLFNCYWKLGEVFVLVHG